MRSTILYTVIATLLISRAASAEPTNPETIIADLGLGGGGACLHFVDSTAVDFRKERWLRALETMWKHDPEYVLAWIVGAEDPPALVAAEASRQRHCLMERIVADAADPRSPLVLDWQHEDAEKSQMSELRDRFDRSPSFRAALTRQLTRSEYRDARTQSWIWKRKFVFSGRNFNYISPHAASKCGLTAGHTWKPDYSVHRQCWEGELQPADREREILLASAAPGISRHHWGTDFDFFGLNPQQFRTGRLADEYDWMTEHALEFGFFQPYATTGTTEHRYMEERWHWSYYPIGQALLEFAAAHTNEVGDALDSQWSGFEARWNRGRSGERPFFGYVRAHWREFMFNVDDQIVRRRPRVTSQR